MIVLNLQDTHNGEVYNEPRVQNAKFYIHEHKTQNKSNLNRFQPNYYFQ